MNINEAKARDEEAVAAVKQNRRALKALAKWMREAGCYRGFYARAINLLLTYFRGRPYSEVERRVRLKPDVGAMVFGALINGVGETADGKRVALPNFPFDKRVWPVMGEISAWLDDREVTVVLVVPGSAKARRAMRKDPMVMELRAAYSACRSALWRAEVALRLLSFTEEAALFVATIKSHAEATGENMKGATAKLGIFLASEENSRLMALVDAEPFLKDLRDLSGSLMLKEKKNGK